jgi:hypothetical protein
LSWSGFSAGGGGEEQQACLQDGSGEVAGGESRPSEGVYTKYWQRLSKPMLRVGARIPSIIAIATAPSTDRALRAWRMSLEPAINHPAKTPFDYRKVTRF